MVWIMTHTTLSGTPAVHEPETASAFRGVSAFKDAFRRHAAGVAVVTAMTPEGVPVGFTATSLASLAAAPPLATFNMARASSAWPAIESTDHVIIHLLGLRNQELARTLSGPHEQRFTGNHWHVGPRGLPQLHGVTAWMLGRIVERVPVASNAIIAVEIEQGGLGEPDDALIYHERRYTRPVAEVE